ncbi:hypothetical protein LTR66_017977, partial [Elasticomyces elasticus]
MAPVATSPAAATTPRPLPKYVQAEVTKQQLDWADLVTLDLEDFDRKGGKQELAEQLFDAVQSIGFFHVNSYGLTQEETDLPRHLENGRYNGYKPSGTKEIVAGIFDNTEVYNIPKFIPHLTESQKQPELILEHAEEVASFARRIFKNVVRKSLVLFAIVLALPEDHFLQSHEYEDISDCYLRYMKYHRRTPEQNKAIDNVWAEGHTDFGSLTLLFRQPIASLQVRTPDGQWKWVKPYPESITVNLADVLQSVTNGFPKSSIHRVVVPPQDQSNVD